MSEAVKAVTNVAPIPSAAMAQPGHHRRGLGPVGGDGVSGGSEAEAGDRDDPGVDAGQRLAAGVRSGDRRDGDRQEGQAHVQGAVVVCVLQREGGHEEPADQQPGGGQHQEAAGQHRPAAEQADG